MNRLIVSRLINNLMHCLNKNLTYNCVYKIQQWIRINKFKRCLKNPHTINNSIVNMRYWNLLYHIWDTFRLLCNLYSILNSLEISVHHELECSSSRHHKYWLKIWYLDCIQSTSLSIFLLFTDIDTMFNFDFSVLYLICN